MASCLLPLELPLLSDSRLAATVKEAQHGDYTYAFLIAAALSLVGIALTMILIFTNKALLEKATKPIRSMP